MRNNEEQVSASDSYIDLNHAPYVSYGVKYIDLVSLSILPQAPSGPARVENMVRMTERTTTTSAAACALARSIFGEF